MSPESLQQLLHEQCGVVARRQLLGLGLSDSFIKKRLRKKDWAAVHQGVYVNHTGEPSWLQRAWAAVLYYWPAALTHESALRAYDLRVSSISSSGTIHVAIDQTRRVAETKGIRVHRLSRFAELVHPARTPPSVRLEHALLDVAADASDTPGAVAVLGDACQTRRTTPERLLQALRTRTRLPCRRFMLDLLADVASGAYSALEHRYLVRVERPHGLPTGTRQRLVRRGRSAAYTDVYYRLCRLVVELDGRLGHELSEDRWADMERDVDSAVDGELTVRLGWRQSEQNCPDRPGRRAPAPSTRVGRTGSAVRPRLCPQRRQRRSSARE